MVVAEEQIVIVDEWRGLYSESWKGVIVDDAFAHPAKFSRALIRRIYDHVIAEGWAAKGDSVIDPFGGVALGGFDAMRHGLNWFGCEIEQKFVELGGNNIAVWNERFSSMPNWGTARLLQGDSRNLVEILSAADCCISSPPYAGNEKSDYLMSDDGKTRRRDEKRGYRQGHGCFRGSEGAYGNTEGQLGAMKEGDLNLAVSSPPYQSTMERWGEGTTELMDIKGVGRYGVSDGQLGVMKEGDHSIAISSPPYVSGGHHNDIMGAWNANGRGQGVSKDEAGYGKTEGQLGAMPEGQLCVTSPPYNPPMSQDHNGTRGGQRGTTPSEKGAFVKYGNSDGQLEGMSMDGFSAAVSSPPYEGSEGSPSLGSVNKDNWGTDGRDITARRGLTAKYGETDGQMGHTTGETFWSASRLILEQLHQILTPNAHAVFVVKAFVRDKKIVDFPAQWAQLCEAVGFKLLHDHHALLTEHYGTQGGFEEDKQLRVERKSFFRRLAEQKGSPRIDYENVLCFRKVA